MIYKSDYNIFWGGYWIYFITYYTYLIMCCRPISLLQTQTPALVRALHRQLKEKSIKTRQGCFNVLIELVHVLPGALSEHIPALIPGIQFSLGYVTNKCQMDYYTVCVGFFLSILNICFSVVGIRIVVLIWRLTL